MANCLEDAISLSAGSSKSPAKESCEGSRLRAGVARRRERPVERASAGRKGVSEAFEGSKVTFVLLVDWGSVKHQSPKNECIGAHLCGRAACLVDQWSFLRRHARLSASNTLYLVARRGQGLSARACILLLRASVVGVAFLIALLRLGLSRG